MLQEHAGPRWNQRVSSYRKLRLAPEWVATAFEKAGLRMGRKTRLRRLVRLVVYGP